MRFLLILALALSIQAQWLNHPTPGAPRTKDGKPNLSGPAPKASNGKPDLSGVWLAEPTPPSELAKLLPPGDPVTALGEGPPNKYLLNILGDFKPGEEPIRPEAATIFKARFDAMGKDIPTSHCLPASVPLGHLLPIPYKLVQTPGLVVTLHEWDTSFRQIFTDGRSLPADPQPSWLGYSVGKWEGDTLVVETAGFNDKSWLDAFGHPHSEALRVTERFRRRDFGHLDVQITIDDPKTYTKLFTVKFTEVLMPDTDLIESYCAEHEKDRVHLDAK